MKKLTFLFAALFTLLTVSAKTLYLNPQSGWQDANAEFAAWAWSDDKAIECWIQFNTLVEGTTMYSVEVDDKINNLILFRLAPGTAVDNTLWSYGTENSPVWAKTGDITNIGENNCFTNSDYWNFYLSIYPPSTPPTTYTFTLKFQKPLDWAEVAIYAWTATGNEFLGNWPGKVLTADDDGWYTHTFTDVTDDVKFIINNNNQNKQTDNINVADLHEDGCFALDETGKKLVAIDCATKLLTNIILSNETLKLRPGHSYQLTITQFLPEDATNKEITWSTTDENIVTVENGRITAVAVGDPVTITAQANDGSGVKAECVVTVSEDEDALEGLMLNFKKHDDWEKVNLYAWTNINGVDVPLLKEWPGTEMTNADSEGVYSYTFDANYTSISYIFNDGTHQTTDLTLTENTCVIVEKQVESVGEGEDATENVKYVATIVDCDTWAPVVIHVESITWRAASTPSTLLYVGDIEELNIDINPNTASNQALKFEASTEGLVEGSIVAHPTGGYPVLTIRALAKGATTITITSEDNAEAKLTYELTVKEPLIYHLDGGAQVEWATPQDMYNTLNQDWNTFSGNTSIWKALENLSTDPADGIPTEAANMRNEFAESTTFQEHFKWLVEYMVDKCTEANVALPLSQETTTDENGVVNGGAPLRYNLAAFFQNTVRTIWPKSADYTTCGISSEAWRPYFEFYHAPTKIGHNFTGWYSDEDCQNKITEMPTEGNVYAGWEALPIEYYMQGFINSQDYEGTDYKFVENRLKVTFTQTSYVYIKSNHGQLYNVDYTDWTNQIFASVTLNKVGDVMDGTKIGVPANKELTFTLVVNEDESLTLSFSTPKDPTAIENVPAEEVTIRKVVENGQLYIIRNGEKYTVTGVRVK